jgi:hypothetical protein
VLRPENKRSKLRVRFNCSNNHRAGPSITTRERPEFTASFML